jgi:predicted Zn-dependent peptidase
MLNRTIQPHITQPTAFNLHLKPYQHYVLDNGTNVYAVEAGEQEVIMLELVFNAGNWYEEKNIIAASTNFLLKNGTKNKTAFEINEHFDFHGAYLNRSCYNETSTITLHCLNKHLHLLTPVITELLTDAIFPEKELAIYTQNQKQRLEVNLKKCDFVANRLIDESLFGFHHPYGRYTSTLDYDAVDRESILNFYKQYYQAGNCKIFIAGKLPNDYQAILNKAFGALPFNNTNLFQKEIYSAPVTEKKSTILNDASGVQAAVRIARNFPNKHHPDFQKCLVLNNVFGGFFGSRLMSNIREDKGYTYGIHSYLQNHIHESAWMISTECGRDVSTATVSEVYKEMKRLQDELIDAQELDLVRNYMIGTLLGDLDGPFQILSRWKSYILNNLTIDYFNSAIKTIKTVSAEELQSLAKKYLNPDEFYELVVV